MIKRASDKYYLKKIFGFKDSSKVTLVKLELLKNKYEL